MTTAVQDSNEKQGHFSFSDGFRHGASGKQTAEVPKSLSLMKGRLKLVLSSLKPTSTTYKTDPDFLSSLPFF